LRLTDALNGVDSVNAIQRISTLLGRRTGWGLYYRKGMVSMEKSSSPTIRFFTFSRFA
jgi:hypothetical protein